MNSYHFIIFIIIASRKLKVIFWKHLEDLSNLQTNSIAKIENFYHFKINKEEDGIYIGIFLAQLACRVEVKDLADKIFIAI
jgi:hypothetical protein